MFLVTQSISFCLQVKCGDQIFKMFSALLIIRPINTKDNVSRACVSKNNHLSII